MRFGKAPRHIGLIKLEGYLLYMEQEKAMEDLMNQWKKERKLPKELMQGFLNNILSKCSVEAIILSKELNLPPSIPTPRVTAQ